MISSAAIFREDVDLCMLLLMWKMVPIWMFCGWVLGYIQLAPKDFFGAKIFNTNTLSYRGSQVSSLYQTIQV